MQNYQKMMMGGAPSAPTYRSNGDLVNFDYSSIASWTPLNLAFGQVVQDTHGGDEVFRFQATTENAGNVSRVFKDIFAGATPNVFTISSRVEVSALRTATQGDLSGVPVDYRFDINGITRALITVYSDNIRIRPDSGDIDIPYTFPVGEPIWLNVKVTWVPQSPGPGSASLDLAIGGSLIGTGVDCYRIAPASSDGRFQPAHSDRHNDSVHDSMFSSNLLIGTDWDD